MQSTSTLMSLRGPIIKPLLFIALAVTAVMASAGTHRELRLDGDKPAAEFGYSTAAGDFNGDGYADLAVGVPSYGFIPSGFQDGRVYVYYGAPSGLQAVPDWIAEPAVSGGAGYFGTAVANAGDVNQDGIDDLLVGEPKNAAGGKVYLFLGALGGMVSSGTAPLSAEWGIPGNRPLAKSTDAAATLAMGQGGDNFGNALAAIGDADQDGYADIVVGAYGYNNGQPYDGAAFIYYGTSTGLTGAPQQTLVITQASAEFGRAVAAGDINGDTWPDLIIGADQFDNSLADAGAVFVYYGSSSGVYSSTPDWRFDGDQANGAVGASVASAGDVNGDGYVDIIIGGWAYGNTGAAFVFYGTATGLASSGTSGSTKLAAPTDADWQKLGENLTDAFGTSLAGAGDVNGDGIADLLIGADSYDNLANSCSSVGGEGQAGIYFGSASGPSAVNPDWSVTPSGCGAYGSHYGAWVQAAGDIDGDGRDDYVVSAYRYIVSSTSNPEGAVYAYLSRPAPTVIASPAGGLTTTEAGGIASFTLALNVEPSADVTVDVATSDATEGTVSAGSVTFSGGPGGNWAVPQAITITGKNDDEADGDVPYSITLTVSSDDTNYNGISPAPVTVTNVDNDAAGVAVTPATGVVTEFGVSATFTVALTSRPTADVTIPISSSDISQGTVSPASVTFTNANWNSPRTITVTGANATIANDVYGIILGAATSADVIYAGLDPADVPAVNRYSTVSIAATDAVASEPGTDTGTYTVSRDGNTAFDLAVNYAVSVAGTATGGADFTALSGSVTILAGQTGATITVVPINDNVTEPDETVIVTIAGGAGYVAGAASATVIIVDDDIPPTASFSADQIVAEGSTVTVSVTLSFTALTYPVMIPYTVSGTAANPADHNAVDGVITITSGTTGSLTFTTVRDNISEGDETVIFTMGTPTNATAGARSTDIVTITEGNGIASSSGGGGGGVMGPVFLLAAGFLRMLTARYRSLKQPLPLRRGSRGMQRNDAGSYAALCAALFAVVGLSGCGGGAGGGPLPGLGGDTSNILYAIRGNAVGMSGTLELKNNGIDNLSLKVNGGFTFSTGLATGSAYDVTVFQAPAGQTCTVSNGSGTVSKANVTNVWVNCVTDAVVTYTVGGTLSGLTAGTVVLQANGSDDLSLSADAAFNFVTPIGDGGTYKVTVATQPVGQTCSVANGSGTVNGMAVTDVAITCVGGSGAAVGTRIASKIAAGRDHTCAILDTTGAVKCWGRNDLGQLGLGDTANRGRDGADMGDNLPAVDLGTGHTAIQIATGSDHTCAILEDHSIKCWGMNASGQLGLSGTGNNRGDAPGEMGDNLPAVDLGGRTAVQVAAGWRQTCAVLDDGSVKCWGNDFFGQLGGGNVDLGAGHTAREIAVGDAHACALLDDFSVKCWGYNAYGQLGLGDIGNRGSPGTMGDNLPPVALGAGRSAVQIAAGTVYSCARLDNGTVKCWGGNDYGQLGLATTDYRGDGPGEMGDNLPAVDFGTGRTAAHIAVGHEHACAILDNNTVKCWGYNVFGELGLGDSAKRGDGPNEMGDNLPSVNLGSGRTAVQIAVGNSDSFLSFFVGTHSCAILDNGALKCWGSNGYGQLGIIDAFNDFALGNNPGEMGDALPPIDLGN